MRDAVAQCGLPDYFQWGRSDIHTFWDEAAVLGHARPDAFRWQGPGGGEVLAWVAPGSYVEAGEWGFGLWSREEEAEKLMRARLEEVARGGWDAEDYLVMAALGDNIPASAGRAVLDRIRRWNARHDSPKIVVSTPARFFGLIEGRAGSFPVLRGDWSGWWEPVKAFAPLSTGAYLRAANARQLARAGLRPEAIAHVEECTRCSPGLYHSYRREGRGAGRMISFVGFARGLVPAQTG